MKSKRKILSLSLAALAMAVSIAVSIPVVYADTDGNELKTTAQPDKLVLDLGADWAGAEFELKLDTGVFPVPVVVSEAGVLVMDLGGSTSYMLTLKPSPAAATSEPTPEHTTEPGGTTTPATTAPTAQPAEPKAEASGIPPLHLVLFIGGLLAAVAGLVAMYILKKRREANDDDDDYEYDDEDE